MSMENSFAFRAFEYLGIAYHVWEFYYYLLLLQAFNFPESWHFLLLFFLNQKLLALSHVTGFKHINHEMLILELVMDYFLSLYP